MPENDKYRSRHDSRSRDRSGERRRKDRSPYRNDRNEKRVGVERGGRERRTSRSRSRSRSPVYRRQRSTSRDGRSRSKPRSPTNQRAHSRSRSRSRSPKRRRHHRSRSKSKERLTRRRSRSRSAASSSSSPTSEEEERYRKRRKEKEKHHHSSKRSRSRSRDRKERSSKKDKKERKEKKDKKEKKKGSAVTGQWGKHGIITESDLYTKEPEFRTWLVEERKINPETITKDLNKKEFARYMEDYNTATLPHEKYYDMTKYEHRMSMMRNGETLPPPDDGYDPNADLLAHTSAHKRAAGPQESYLSKEQLMELRRVQNERVQVGKMKLLGMDIKQSVGVRMDGSMFDE